MTLLALHFLVRLRSRLGGATPALTVPPVRRLLSVTLPAQRRDAAAMRAFRWAVPRRNYAAACAHRKRRRHRLRRLLNTS